MGYSIYLTSKDNEDDGCVYSTNLTYNTSKMHYLWNEEKGIKFFDKMTGADAVIHLESLQEFLILNEDNLLQYEPSNGWGTFAWLLEKVSSMLTYSKEYKDYIWEIF